MSVFLTLGMFVFGAILFIRYFVELLVVALVTAVSSGSADVGLFRLLTCILGLVLMFQPW